MTRIKTRSALREYMLRQMGAPTIQIELTEEQLDDCINKAIRRFSEYAYDGTIDGTLLVELDRNKLTYKLPDNVIAITHLLASSAYNTFISIPQGYSLQINPLTLNYIDDISNIDIQTMTERMSRMSNLRNIFDVQVNFNFNYNKKELQFFEYPTSNVAVLEISMDYEPDEVDNIYNEEWVKRRAIGEAFVLWGTVTGKFSSNLLNGTQINYSDIKQEGKDIIQETEDELFEIMEPLGIDIS